MYDIYPNKYNPDKSIIYISNALSLLTIQYAFII
jgi:hypothetical protein